MANFIANNGIISRADATISGSFKVTGQIIPNLNGTASNVVTASYSLTAQTASYTPLNTVSTASYSTITATSSVALTASTVNGLYYGPTPGIGYLSPNIHIGSPTSINVVNGISTYNGTFLTPILITKPCTLVTMSIVGGTSNNTTCSFGLYTNSPSLNLPQYLLAEGVLRSAAITGPAVFNVNNFTPVQLSANTVYWVAFLTNAPANTAFRFMFDVNQANFYSFNPILGHRVSNTTAIVWNPNWCIRSGSNGVGLAVTASQDTGSYGYQPASNQCAILPVLKVTYP